MSDLEAAATAVNDLVEARNLAKTMLNILNQLPASLPDFDERLAYELLPGWIHDSVQPTERITEWCVFVGADNPDDTEDGWLYDDEVEARAIVKHMTDGRLAVRELTAGPWAVEEPAVADA